MNGSYSNAQDVSDAIERHGSIIVSPVSDSMYPLIREQRDAVVLGKARFPLQRFDVALYERDNGMLVLHRVMKAVGHSYDFSGDHYEQHETGIEDSQICALMTGFFHKEKYVSLDSAWYKLYCHVWCGTFFLRKVTVRIWRAIKGITGITKAP